jgi:ribosomal protein S6--L-glutamate ligase
VLEVNSSPGLEGIDTATGVDVAEQIIEFIEEAVEENKAQDPARKKVDA